MVTTRFQAEPYRDRCGLITQTNGDGGDTCARTGNYYFAQGSVPHLKVDIAQLIVNEDYDLVRHPGYPGTPAFWSDTKETSRDQVEAVLLALLQLRQYDLFTKLWRGVIARGFRYQNGDVVSPQMISAYLRAFGASIFWVPVILLCDLLGLVGNALLSCGKLPRWKHETNEFVKSNDPDNVGDDVLFTQHLLFALMNKPSWLAMYAANMVCKKKPENYGNTKLGEKSPIMGALMWYHRADSGGSPIIGEVYRPLVRAYIDERA
jgi:hypothetical protein